MALYHKWDVKNEFAYALKFFSLISVGLGSVTLPRNELLFFLGGIGSNEFHIKRMLGPQGNLKNQNPGGRFGASS